MLQDYTRINILYIQNYVNKSTALAIFYEPYVDLMTLLTFFK